MVRLAVSTLLLAALAVPEVAACPLGRAVDLAEPVLPWQGSPQRPVIAVRARPLVRLVAAVGDGDEVVKAVAGLSLACGSGQGEATLRIRRGQAAVTTTFAPRLDACVRAALDGVRFTRVASDTIARLRIAL